jgi:hypothetical protein
MTAIYSNHSLSDPTVYDDDVIAHFSDQDVQTYYRRLSTLNDTLAMDGNCAAAVPGFGHNEMFPCFPTDVTYGLAVLGLNVSTSGAALPSVSLSTSGAAGEPNTRSGEPAVPLTGTLRVSGLTAGSKYVLYRYNGTDALPAGPPYSAGAEYSTPFTAKGAEWVYADPNPFSSDSATYWLAAPA